MASFTSEASPEFCNGASHLKNWRILAYGYCRLLTNFPATLAAITNLEIYRTATHAS